MKNDNDQKLVSSDFVCIFIFFSFNLTYIKHKYAKYAVFCAI
jgi:hypothetical protein